MRPDDVAEEKIKNRRRRAAHVLLLVLVVVVVVVCFQKRERERVFFSLSLSLSLSLSSSRVSKRKKDVRGVKAISFPNSPSSFSLHFLGFHSPFSFFFFSRERRTPKTRVTPLTWNQPRWLALERDDSREDDDDEEEEEEEETKKRDAIGVVFLSPSVAGKKRG